MHPRTPISRIVSRKMTRTMIANCEARRRRGRRVFCILLVYSSIQSTNTKLPELSFSQLPRLATGMGLPGLFLSRAGFRRKPGRAQARASLLCALPPGCRSCCFGYYRSLRFTDLRNCDTISANCHVCLQCPKCTEGYGCGISRAVISETIS